MSRIIEITTEEDLADLPLRDVSDGDPWAGPDDPLRPAARAASVAPPAARAAWFSRRAMAFAADAALVALVIAAALLGAQLATGRGFRLSGMPWAAAFGVYFSFFAVVLPLLFFGQTLGLALAGLRVREGAGRRGLTLHEAAARWVGTLATAVSLGLPLAFTLRDPESPTLADRLSGRALMAEEVETP